MLHLDVKPENIYQSCGAWRIGDFGLAVARDKEGSMVREADGMAFEGMGFVRNCRGWV